MGIGQQMHIAHEFIRFCLACMGETAQGLLPVCMRSVELMLYNINSTDNIYVVVN